MLLDAEDSAWLERAEGRSEYVLLDAGPSPVMNVAECHDHIRRSIGRDLHLSRGKHGQFDLVERFRVSVEQRMQLAVVSQVALAGRSRIHRRGIQCAVLAQVWGKNLRIPAAEGPQLDDGHVRLNAEEGQRFDWMTVGVSRLVLR